ncbi:hypothetical protein D3C86_1752190 [compost metagenome]
MLQPRFDIADARNGLMQQFVAGMAHIDAEHVRTGLGQLLDHLFLVACRPEGGEDLCASDPSHGVSVLYLSGGGGGRGTTWSAFSGSTRKAGSSRSSPSSGPTTLGAPALSVSCSVQSVRFWVSISKNPVRS